MEYTVRTKEGEANHTQTELMYIPPGRWSQNRSRETESLEFSTVTLPQKKITRHHRRPPNLEKKPTAFMVALAAAFLVLSTAFAASFFISSELFARFGVLTPLPREREGALAGRKVDLGRSEG